ncbi:hypothetical protein HALO59_50671 [Halomonas sp. 59]|nr:hypothetical protein HALO156_130411 [Halomonas sp. 156]CAD5288384.1 hypothetical protein HALO113_80674 [Halomonas sp. 113]CAD5289815.1 hypothetical protein HALO59_50671 [Halomonas sp. 59]CAD5292765.1 hypothetical protein HALOI3_60160 [Halomonas sp. I3]VXB45195.1 hypothetical protein HALO153_130500 [Halomonas titanicae]
MTGDRSNLGMQMSKLRTKLWFAVAAYFRLSNEVKADTDLTLHAGTGRVSTTRAENTQF